MSPAALLHSAQHDSQPPAGLSLEALALWQTKAGHWEAAHNIAQDIHTPMGSWLHALLHLIEGDQWNADYWFSKADKPSRKAKDAEALWDEIAEAVSLATGQEVSSPLAEGMVRPNHDLKAAYPTSLWHST